MGDVYRNFSLQECDTTLAKHLREIQAGRITFYQKFTCEKCWQRIIVDEPNKLFIVGHCQHCNHFTDLQTTGCNYALVISVKSH